MCRISAQNFVTRKVKNMGRIEPEKEIKKVVIHYDDGEEKEIEKKDSFVSCSQRMKA